MRVTITKLMDKGLKRRSRAAPLPGDLRLDVDAEGRRALVLLSRHETALPVIATLLHPQFAGVGKATITAHGYEQDGVSGQLFGQAWEIEPERR